jgi:2-polyprenyl-3-methyl-5-hydroxy-6-metoxy-1,4-benzoquinol methylase
MMLCPICHDKTTPKERSSFFCHACSHTYRPFNGDASKFHAEQYRNLSTSQRVKREFSSAGKVSQAFHDARSNIVNKRRKAVLKFLRDNDKCLDIGSGAGTFAREVINDVESVTCLELDQRLVEESERLGFETLQTDFLETDIEGELFDHVFAWHVLEHVDNVHEFLRKCCSISRNKVFIEVPTRRRVTKHFDGHIHYFSPNSLRKLAQLASADFEVESIAEGIQSPASLMILSRI